MGKHLTQKGTEAVEELRTLTSAPEIYDFFLADYENVGQAERYAAMRAVRFRHSVPVMSTYDDIDKQLVDRQENIK